MQRMNANGGAHQRRLRSLHCNGGSPSWQPPHFEGNSDTRPAFAMSTHGFHGSGCWAGGGLGSGRSTAAGQLRRIPDLTAGPLISGGSPIARARRARWREVEKRRERLAVSRDVGKRVAVEYIQERISRLGENTA